VSEPDSLEAWLALVDTGPLISALQSDSLGLLVAVFGTLHTSQTCLDELVRHGWEQAIAQAGRDLAIHPLMPAERERVRIVAGQIAEHRASRNRDVDHHLGEAEIIVLAQRDEHDSAIVLLDKVAARSIARDVGLRVSGFAGVLLLAAQDGLLTPEQARDRLQRCQRQGTHYSDVFVERIYRAAQESTRDDR